MPDILSWFSYIPSPLTLTFMSGLFYGGLLGLLAGGTLLIASVRRERARGRLPRGYRSRHLKGQGAAEEHSGRRLSLGKKSQAPKVARWARRR